MAIKNIAGFQDQRPASTQTGGHASQSTGKDEGIVEASGGAPWFGELGLRPDCSQDANHAKLGGPSGKSEQ